MNKRLKTIEIFSGTKSFSKVMQKHGHAAFTVDNDENLKPDLVADIRYLRTHKDIPYDPLYPVDILWCSPPCQGFSVAAIGKNWHKDNTPKTDSARLSMELVAHTIRIINQVSPRWWFIENPRGKLRKLDLAKEIEAMGGVRHTVTYCQYGDIRMKPTDIWTNAYWWKPKPICKNGAPCHERAPRGARTGTQGIDGAKDRGRIPARLFEEILKQMP